MQSTVYLDAPLAAACLDPNLMMLRAFLLTNTNFDARAVWQTPPENKRRERKTRSAEGAHRYSQMIILGNAGALPRTLGVRLDINVHRVTVPF